MNIKALKKTIDKFAGNLKTAMYVLMVARILIALYLRVHHRLDEDYFEE